MKWKQFPIPSDDRRAKAHIVENLTVGARGHSLSKKLLERFGDARGQFVLIAFESIDLDYPYLYKYAT